MGRGLKNGGERPVYELVSDAKGPNLGFVEGYRKYSQLLTRCRKRKLPAKRKENGMLSLLDSP